MKEKELKQLSANPLFSIGAHTVNDPQLNRYFPDQQKKEISESRHSLEKITGNLISTFAFPFWTSTKKHAR
jgi:peptidoglycan/xylan/chitin deacetylase (PgdA/CDA1 family)